jgi:hypothetical protein
VGRDLHGRWRRWAERAAAVALAVVAARLFAPWWCGREAAAWYRGDEGLARALAAEVMAFEADDDRQRRTAPASDRFAGEWALVTHQMTALGLAQVCLAHPEWRPQLAPEVTRAALKSFGSEMRGFGTSAWGGEDALRSLDGWHGHAYVGYPALALGMARLVDPAFPRDVAAQHDALILAYERRLLASTTGLIETYPREAYPTDVAAVAGAIAVHGRVTGVDHARVLRQWAERVRALQLDATSGYVVQRMNARTGERLDAPRGSGTALASYFAGFADRSLAEELAASVVRHESSFWGFGAIREYGEGHNGRGDIDSGPVVFGVSVAATGFALASTRAFRHEDAFERIYRTTDLFGVPVGTGDRLRFVSGAAIGNALLLAFLTSGPELAR